MNIKFKLLGLIITILLIGISISAVSAGSDDVTPTSFPVSKTPELAKIINSKNCRYPVNFENVNYNKSECVYILAKAVLMINEGDSDGVIHFQFYKYGDNSYGSNKEHHISKEQYIDICSRMIDWIDTHHQLPNYISVYDAGVQDGNQDLVPNRVLIMCCNILEYYKNTGKLPSNIII